MTVYNHEDAEEIRQLLTGRRITRVNDDTLHLDDGTELTFVGNHGCGGCSNGQYDLVELNGVDNTITNVELANNADDDGIYQIFVYADNVRINLARFEGGDGNGYYGTGYTIHVRKAAPR